MTQHSCIQNNNLLWRIRNSQIKHRFLVMLDSRVSHERLNPLRKHFIISLILWHLSVFRPHIHVCTHTHLPFITIFLCAIEVWFLCSLFFCCPQLNSVSFLPFYSMDPPWIWALTPDERHFISELLTQFHRVCFLFEEEIKNKILFTAFFFF